MKPLLSPHLLLDNIWSIDGPANDLMYLVVGSRRAMLVDTGWGLGNLSETVRSLTNLPVIVINTHGHPDHAGGNRGFKEVWLDPRDETIIRRMTAEEALLHTLKLVLAIKDIEFEYDYEHLAKHLVPFQTYKLLSLRPGQVFDLGERRFEVVPLPGHSPGSVCLLNSTEKLLFAGDAMVSFSVWMHLEECTTLSTYLASLKKVQARENEFETILSGHQPAVLDRSLLHDLIFCAEEILSGKATGEPADTFIGEGLQWKHGAGTIVYSPNRLR